MGVPCFWRVTCWFVATKQHMITYVPTNEKILELTVTIQFYIYIKLWAQAVCLNKPFNTRTALASCFALSMQHWLWDAFFTHRCCTWVQGCNTHYYLSLLYVRDLTQRNLFNIFLYIYIIYICSRFSWNISHTSHLLKDYAYVVVDANACRQKQVYLLNSNAYSQLFSDHPSLYIYICIYIYYIYVYLKSIGATFFSRGLGDLLSGLGCAKTGCQGGRLWGKSWGFCHWIGLVGTIWYNLIPIQWGGEAPKLTVGS